MGPLRRLLPNPVQSNWRLYCPDGTIYFLHSFIEQWPHAVGARLFSDGLPAVWDPGLVHQRDGDTLSLTCTRVALRAKVRVDHTAPLNRDAAWLIQQAGAVDVDTLWDVVRLSAIDLPIDLNTVQPATLLDMESTWLEEITAGCTCVAFVVPQVAFKALGERVIADGP